jgi:MFS family permease
MQARLAVAAGIAMTIGPILFGFVGERRGLPAIFGVASVIALVGAVYFMLAVQETHPHVRSVQARLAPRWGWLGRWLDDPPRLR